MDFGKVLTCDVLSDVLKPVHDQQQVDGVVFCVVIHEIGYDYVHHLQQLIESLPILQP